MHGDGNIMGDWNYGFEYRILADFNANKTFIHQQEMHSHAITHNINFTKVL